MLKFASERLETELRQATGVGGRGDRTSVRSGGPSSSRSGGTAAHGKATCSLAVTGKKSFTAWGVLERATLHIGRQVCRHEGKKRRHRSSFEPQTVLAGDGYKGRSGPWRCHLWQT